MQFAFRRDLALGRYVPLETPLHHLDPRTKLLGFAVALAALFLLHGPFLLAVVLTLAFLVRLARLPGSQLLSALRSLAWILLLTIAFQALWVGPRQLGGVPAGLVAGVLMALRLVGMLLAALLLTWTTEPIRLADALARLFGFLEKVRVPVRDLAMVLTLALRFLPTVMEEAERIVTVQRARGATFGGNLLTRARSLLPLAVPLFAGCLQRADRLALAMEARGWRSGAPRTQMHPLELGRSDWVALIVLAAAAALLIADVVARGGI